MKCVVWSDFRFNRRRNKPTLAVEVAAVRPRGGVVGCAKFGAQKRGPLKHGLVLN